MSAGVCTSRTSGAYRASEVAVAVTARLWKPDTTRRGVIVAHGYGTSADNYFTSPLLNDLADANLAAVVTDLGGASTWGNDTTQAAITDAKAWLGTPIGAKTDKVLLHGGSMGSLGVLNWAIAHPTLVAAIVCELPACDLQDIHDNGGYSAPIETAYTDHAGYLAALAAHSPVRNAAALAGIPVQLWYSTTDPIVAPSTVLALAAAIGPSAVLVSVGAVGHSLPGINRTPQMQFLAPYA